MAERAWILNDIGPVRSFHVLFMSEGFKGYESEIFDEFCRNITRELLKIKPYNILKPRMDIRALFERSESNEIKNVAGDTAFGFYISNNRFVTDKIDKVVDAIDNMEILLRLKNKIVAQPGRDIWINNNTKGSRIICIVINHHEKIASAKINLEPDEFDKDKYPAEKFSDVSSILPFIALSLYPNKPDKDGNKEPYDNPFKISASILAREIGHAFGLAYEHERSSEDFERYNGGEPQYPNVTALSTIKKDDGIDIQKIKWLPLIEQSRKNRIVPFEHPSPDGDSQQYENIYQEALKSIILLKHYYNESSPEDTSPYSKMRYCEGDAGLLFLNEPNLIEGGKYYRRDIYRPCVECLMRWSGYDVDLSNGKKKQKLIPYCRVCYKHLLAKIGKLYNFKLGGVQILPDTITQGIFSELAEKFVEFIIKTKDKCNWTSMNCVAATFRRFEAFFKNALKWEWKHTVIIDDESLREDFGGSLKMECPRLLNEEKWDLWNLWLTRQEQLRTRMKEDALKYVDFIGAGAAGAIAFSGFGVIANKGVYKIGEDSAGKKIIYHEFQNLTNDDLENLTPGSVMQLWHENDYRDIIKYIVGIKPDKPSSMLSGHSVIYMGKKNGKYRIADDNGINRSLSDSMYEFYIAAQWFDAKNIPSKNKWIINLNYLTK